MYVKHISLEMRGRVTRKSQCTAGSTVLKMAYIEKWDSQRQVPMRPKKRMQAQLNAYSLRAM